MVNRSFRSRIATLAAAALPGDTQISLADASAFMNGDVLELASGERVEITSDPNPITNTVTVRRGAEGTLPAAGVAGDLIRLIGKRRSLSTEFPCPLILRHFRPSASSAFSAETAFLPPYLCHSLSTPSVGEGDGRRAFPRCSSLRKPTVERLDANAVMRTIRLRWVRRVCESPAVTEGPGGESATSRP